MFFREHGRGQTVSAYSSLQLVRCCEQCRFVIPTEETKRKLPDFPAAGDSGVSILEGPQQLARRSDMDMNGHINNVTYLAWALESVPQEVNDGYSLFEVSS